MLCDAFCPHTALPRAKGMHQPRDSAIFFSTKQTPQRQRATSARAYSKRVQTVEGGAGGAVVSAPLLLRPPVCVVAGRRSTGTPPPGGGQGTGQGEARQTAAGGGRVSQPHQLSGIAHPLPTPTTPFPHASPYHMSPPNPGVGSGCPRPFSSIAGVSPAVL